MIILPGKLNLCNLGKLVVSSHKLGKIINFSYSGQMPIQSRACQWFPVGEYNIILRSGGGSVDDLSGSQQYLPALPEAVSLLYTDHQ